MHSTFPSIPQMLIQASFMCLTNWIQVCFLIRQSFSLTFQRFIKIKVVHEELQLQQTCKVGLKLLLLLNDNNNSCPHLLYKYPLKFPQSPWSIDSTSYKSGMVDNFISTFCSYVTNIFVDVPTKQQPHLLLSWREQGQQEIALLSSSFVGYDYEHG